MDLNYENILSRLIAEKTVNPPGNELELCIYLDEVLSEIGFETEIQNLGNNRGNIVAKYGSDNPDIKLMLTGHLDVVGIDDGWITDPFVLTKKNNKYFGRGTCDMKGAIATMVSASFKFLEYNKNINNQLILAFVCDEEVTGNGSKELVKSDVSADYVIIGEPTNMDVCIAHRGVNRYKLTIKGKAGHASNPDNSTNSLYFTAKIISEIEKLQEKLSKIKHKILPSPSIVTTIVKGGVQGNSIPEICELIVDRRTIPLEDKDYVEKEIKEIVGRVNKEYPTCDVEYSTIAWIPATEPKENAILPNIAENVLRNINIDTTIKDFPAGCDQYIFSEKNMDTILIGPGSLKQAHTANEYIEISELEKAEQFYMALMEKILL